MHQLSFDLQHIKQEYEFLKEYGANNPSEYLKGIHSQAFCKTSDCSRALAYLLVFLSYRCNEFKILAPKDEFGIVILDIADLYAQSKEPTQEQINEAITAILLEFYSQGVFYDKALYQILCDYVSNPTENSPKRSAKECGVEMPKLKDDNNDENTPKPQSNYVKLNDAIAKGEFKNKQVRDRAVAVYKLLHNCEPTKKDLEMTPSEEDKERIMTEQEMPFDKTPRQYSQAIASGI